MASVTVGAQGFYKTALVFILPDFVFFVVGWVDASPLSAKRVKKSTQRTHDL
ncbi:MAG: hypothetical protein ACRCT1_05735 [Microcoleaceae cyanobacterium]